MTYHSHRNRIIELGSGLVNLLWLASKDLLEPEVAQLSSVGSSTAPRS